ncbi:MAG: winged helix-turn-helix transcriptional regulator, partial [Caldibacillus sp.]
PKRFCKIEAALPISARLLTERLKELEKSGIVQRKVYTDSRVEYSLTEKGLALTPAIRELEKWAQRFVEIENFSQESPITTVEKGRGQK